MLDANGREIRVGDWVATPWLHLVDMPEDATAEAIAHLPTTIKDAVLGRVIEMGEDFQGECVHLGDGIYYGAQNIVTLGGLELVTCPECGMPWPFDVRMNDREECPSCNYQLVYDDCPYPCSGCEAVIEAGGECPINVALGNPQTQKVKGA